MIGMPTPTCVPSDICSETWTGLLGSGAALVLDEPVLGPDEPVDAVDCDEELFATAPPPCPDVLVEQAVVTAATTASPATQRSVTEPGARRGLV
jgi:hypothetical protein